MASDYTREWIQFFRGCGIPDDIAARYGLVFNENRIQKNMLLDLNKEYLRDMGITVMGDIIAILRHAKIVHDIYIREQILSDPAESAPAENVAVNDTVTPKQLTPVKRILEHYTRKNDPSKFNVPHEKVQIRIENDNNLVNVPKNLTRRLGVQNKGAVKNGVETPSVKSDDLLQGKLEVSVSNFRRTMPENEGNYTVKMPSGTTERSKKLLEKVKLKHNKTVFDRLGESSVSSTSDVSTTSGTTIHTSKVQNSKEKSASVFSRLGEKSPLVTSTSSSANAVEVSDQLPYKGILKSNPVKKKVQVSPNSTMRADNELNVSNASNPLLKKLSLVKERLGTSLKSNESSQSDASLKRSRLQITTTSDERSIQGRTLLRNLKSVKTGTEESVKEKKNLLDGLSRFRSDTPLNKSNVTSTTQLPNAQRGLKRRLQDVDTPDSQVSDIAQSKKVRFGRTTHRLIPGNTSNTDGSRSDFQRQTGGLREGYEKFNTKRFTLKSGLRIGPVNSDKFRGKSSLKDRIGLGSLSSKSGKIAIDLKRKRSLKFNSKFRKAPITVHDRLG